MSEEKVEITKVATFDPNKRYTWPHDVELTITGGEFGVMLNAIRAIAEATGIAQTAAQVIEDALVRNVEAGVIKEAPEQN